MAETNVFVEKVRMPQLLAAKKNGKALTTDQVKQFVTGVVDRSIPEEQIGAMLMAIYLKGMTTEETVALTTSFVESGSVLTWNDKKPEDVVDKHSTGGVGDKVSLPLAPALAACGARVPMISGRGLGHTGGTLDKLESIPGFSVDQSTERIYEMVEKVGCCIVGQTESLCPADRIIYAIRDVTSTVESLPLITASIVSKKVAEGLSSLLLDVKVGAGAFMKTEEEARALARSMVDAGNGKGVKTIALLTEMNNPIGRHIGNANEVAESIEVLQGKGPADLIELVVAEGGHLLFANGKAATPEEGMEKIKGVLTDGSALKKFEEMAVMQGVTKETAANLCKDPWSVLNRGAVTTTINSTQSGYIDQIDSMSIAVVASHMGAGRQVKTDKIKHEIGVHLLQHIGDQVESGTPWLEIYHNEPLSEADRKTLEGAFTVSATKVETKSRILGSIE